MKVCTRETKRGPEKYNSYILVYVDDVLCIHDDPDSILTQIDKYFLLKPDSVGEQDVYLGAKQADAAWKWHMGMGFEPV